MFLVYFSFYIIKSYFLLHGTFMPTNLILLYVRSIEEADKIKVNLKKISGYTCLVQFQLT